ncbi:hypothetical protein ACGFNX_40215 [Streptomyces sp. NPDC048723]|uniref:hypothetical protein n=1 Tax=Streptomyces sp. NPDC048723 TaxID=3365589 RepID=UPI0037213EE3
MPETTTKQRLLPAEEHFLRDLFSLEEPLLIWLWETARDARAGADDVYELPAGLDGEQARDAWGRIFTALPAGLRNEWHALRTGQEPEGGNRIYGADGHEHSPLYAVSVDQGDIDVLVELLNHCRKALARESGYSDLHSILDEAGEWYGNAEGAEKPETAEQVVGRLARAVAVLQLDHDGMEPLLEAVSSPGPDGRITLTPSQAATADRYFERVIAVVTDGMSPLDRALVRFVEFGDTHTS